MILFTVDNNNPVFFLTSSSEDKKDTIDLYLTMLVSLKSNMAFANIVLLAIVVIVYTVMVIKMMMTMVKKRVAEFDYNLLKVHLQGLACASNNNKSLCSREDRHQRQLESRWWRCDFRCLMLLECNSWTRRSRSLYQSGNNNSRLWPDNIDHDCFDH